ncbi:MAG: NAD(P)-dependent alcohol dehydrogenase [Bacteroidia bacterium]|nr:NAD(P)-dependent alcohol dehydrogenase [Bacteroidia bacterium]
MKAAVYTRYGAPEVLRMNEVDMPVPGDREILLRIKATAVNSGDVRLRKADPFAVRLFFGLRKPKLHVLGSVFSGEVVDTGKEVTRFKRGDQVFGHTDMRFGAYAEYLSVPEDGSLALKPAALSHTEAAVIPFGGVTAWHFLKKVVLKPGQKVLVVGASGAVGSAAVQLAKAHGARVTAVSSSANFDLVKSIGADKVIDYTQEDFTLNGERYDLIFDAVNTIPVFRSAGSLTKNGTMILSAAGLPEMLKGLWISLSSGRKVWTGIISHQASDIAFLKDLVQAGKYKPVIDRTYPLSEMAAAHAYVEKGHKKGNVAIEV